MTRRTQDGNVQQRVFDAIMRRGGEATSAEIIADTGLDMTAVRNAISDLRKRFAVNSVRAHCVYTIPLGTPRPQDLRGQMREDA